MSDYQAHFAKALRFIGYAVLSTAGEQDVPIAAQALSQARSRLAVLSQDANWTNIEERLRALGGEHVSVVGFLHNGLTADEPGFHVAVLRQVSRFDIADEQAFVNSFGKWLASVKPWLPKFQLSADTQSAAKGLLTTAGANPLLAAGIEMVLQFAQASGEMKSLSVLPMTNVSAQTVSTWQAADLVNEPMLGNWVIEWMWNTDDDSVHEGGHSRAERSDRTAFGGANGLADALRATRN